MTLIRKFLRLIEQPHTFSILIAGGRHLVFTSEREARGYAAERKLAPVIYPLEMTREELRRSLK